ncbi:hypothetical protein ACLOJK_020099 [Asimina triloba]
MNARVVERSPQSDPKRRGRRRKKPPFCFGSSSHSIPSLTDQKEEFGEEEADLRCWIDPASSFMASSKKEILLPVSDPPSRAAGDESIFKGAAMTKRGAYAAISYMSCADDMFNSNPYGLSIKLATMESVRGVTVPMYTTLRRTTVVFTMIVEYLLTGQKYSSSVVGSVGLIVFGAFVAGTRDLSFDSYGYAIVFLSNITTAIYLATIARIATHHFSNETDRLALLRFRSHIQDPSHSLASWNDTLHFCQWQGVTCGRCHPQRVTALNLVGYNLVGRMPSHMANLTFLRRINLSNNTFHGAIPGEIGRLFRLQYLILTNNTLSGEIPVNLTYCWKLKHLRLDQNKLVGSIPEELGSLSKLARLVLGPNDLTGTIPPSLGNLSSLRELFLVDNRLNGDIHADLSRLTNLVSFVVGGNDLSGTIPSSYNISSIQTFDVSKTSMCEGDRESPPSECSRIIISASDDANLNVPSPPSLGPMKDSHLNLNVLPLGILVITDISNICIQMGSGVIHAVLPEHIALL